MHVGRVLGRSLLALIDAMAAAFLVASISYFTLPIVFLSTRIELVAVVFTAVVGVVLAVALALASVGQRPFPATRLAKAVFVRLPLLP